MSTSHKNCSIPADTLRSNLPYGKAKLMALYAMAVEQEFQDGLTWYSRAYDYAVKTSANYGINLDCVIDCIACLSPNTEWSVNQDCTEKTVRYFVTDGYVPNIERYPAESLVDLGNEVSLRCPSYGSNVLKALWILQGHDVLSGVKVESFAHNIRHYNDPSAVTVDSHAVAAWLGWISPGTWRFDNKFYDVIAHDYMECASSLGLLPLQFQAIVWLAKKRIAKGDGLTITVDEEAD